MRQDNNQDKGRRKKMILILLHSIVGIGIVFLVVGLINAHQRIAQITMIPTPGPVETLPEESLPLANPTPSPTLTGGTATPTATVSPTATATPTPTPTPEPTPTPRPTDRPSRTPKPPEPTPEFTYKVSAERGVAPAGKTFVFVKVTPPGDYTVTYDGRPMTKNGNEYYIITDELEGGYRSHVRVTKN